MKIAVIASLHVNDQVVSRYNHAVLMAGAVKGLPSTVGVPAASSLEVVQEGERLMADTVTAIEGADELYDHERDLTLFTLFQAAAWTQRAVHFLSDSYPDACLEVYTDSAIQAEVLRRCLPGMPVDTLPTSAPTTGIGSALPLWTGLGRRFDRRPVLMLCRSMLGCRVLTPVADGLREQGVVVIFVAVSKEVAAELWRRGHDVISLWDYAPLTGVVGTAFSLLAYRLRRRSVDALTNRVNRYRVQRRFVIGCMDRLLDWVKPACFVSADHASRLDNLLGQRAAERGVTTVAIQHGLLAYEPSFKHLPFHHFLTFGEYSSEVLVAAGFPGATHSTGAPMYDHIFHHQVDRSEARRNAGLTGDQPVVLVAGQVVEGAHTLAVKRQMLAGIAQAAGVGGFTWIYRPHPREADSLAADLLPSSGVKLDCTTGLYDAIAVADVVVTDFSTVAVEAAILRRPVLVYDHPGRPNPLPFAEQGVAFPWSEGKALQEQLASGIVNQALADGVRERFLALHAAWDGQGALHRVVQFLKKRVMI